MAVTGAGLCLVALLVALHGPAVVTGAEFRFWLFAAFVILCELLPIQLPGGRQDRITLSTSFAFALLLTVGIPGAVLVQTAASIFADVRSHKALRVTLFNVAQYALALTAAGLVLQVTAGVPHPSGSAFAPADVPWLMAAAGVFFLVNQGLTATIQALAHGEPLLDHVRRDLGFHTFTAATLLGLGPLVVVAADFSFLLLPLLLLPLAAVYRGGRQAMVNQHQAFHDGLTGLANRALLHDRIAQALLVGQREGTTGGVLLLDLDRFKEVNDTLGHRYGDLLLQQVGPRLREALRDSDTVARLGGDEFAVLMAGVNEQSAGTVSEKIAQALERPFVVEGITLDVGASIGIALYPAHGADVDTLIQRADVAMYLAKEAHSSYELYDPEQDLYSRGRLALVGQLRRAVERGELVVHYQPKAEAPTGRIAGLEALVRWPHPDRGLLGPDEFIPLGEQTGLIRPIARFVLDTALSELADWRIERPGLTMAVNLSARNLLDPQLPEDVAASLERHGLQADALVLELTEGTIMADPTRALAVLDRLSLMGVRLAIDDFGVGYSSLGYLKRLPVDEIKIDKSFVLGMTDDEGDAVIVRSTIDLGRNLGLGVVAEGVENDEAWAQLALLGCDRVQGYGLSRPLPAEALTLWLAEWVGAAPEAGLQPVSPAERSQGRRPSEALPATATTVAAHVAATRDPSGGPAARVPPRHW